MKKSYTITPEEYHKKLEEIRDIKYKYGCSDFATISENAPERVKKRFNKLIAEVKAFAEPQDSLFLRNPDLYNLWLNRNTDEPITARELFNIIAGVSEAIDRAEDRAKTHADWANFDGRF